MSVATTQSRALRYFERVPMTTPAVSPLKYNTFLHALPGDVWAKRPPVDIQCLGGTVLEGWALFTCYDQPNQAKPRISLPGSLNLNAPNRFYYYTGTSTVLIVLLRVLYSGGMRLGLSLRFP